MSNITFGEEKDKARKEARKGLPGTVELTIDKYDARKEKVTFKARHVEKNITAIFKLKKVDLDSSKEIQRKATEELASAYLYELRKHSSKLER